MASSFTTAKAYSLLFLCLLFLPWPHAHAKKKATPRGTLVIHGTGDLNFDPRIQSNFRRYGFGYAWSGLDGIFQKDDLTVINLECAVTRRGRPFPKKFTFRAPETILPFMKTAGVEVANMGNNHSWDFSEVGLLDTHRNLLRYGIQPVGAGKDLAEAIKPAIFYRKGWRIAVLGFGGVVHFRRWVAKPDRLGMANGKDTALMVRAVKAAKKKADIVVVTIHWGVERDEKPRRGDIRRAKAMIDAGADMIFGHHAHVIQPMTYYKSRPIFWGLGNFVWPKSRTPGARTTIARVVVTPDKEFRGSFVPARMVSSGRPVLLGKARVMPRGFRKTRPWQPPPLSRKQRLLLKAKEKESTLVSKCLSSSRHFRRCRWRWHNQVYGERYHFLFRPYIHQIGGGYIGVGGEQNFSLLAWAHARYGWIVNEDPLVSHILQIQRAFLLASPNRRTYLKRWVKGREFRRSIKLLEKHFQGKAKRKSIIQVFRRMRSHIRRRSLSMWKRRRYRRYRRHPHWLHSKDSYLYIRKMFQTGRLRLLQGHLGKGKSLQHIAAASRQLGISIRVVYLSNQEEKTSYSKGFRLGLQSLPFDRASVVLRTLSLERRYGPRLRDGRIYVVQGGMHLAEKLGMPSYKSIHSMMQHNRWLRRGFFSIF